MNGPEVRYIAIGQVLRAHGVRGEVSVTVLTDFPERFETTEWVYLGSEFEAEAYHIKSYRWHKKNILLTLSGVTDRTQAEKLTGQYVQVPIEDAVALPEGSYYLFELLGLQVVTTAGEILGTVDDVLETGSNSVLVVKNGDRNEVLLPYILDVVKSVNLETGQVVVTLIDGLI
jgi:16S rRNA processing protein RimM